MIRYKIKNEGWSDNYELYDEFEDKILTIFEDEDQAVLLCTLLNNKDEEYKQQMHNLYAAQESSDYTWPQVSDYENEVGSQVNMAFKMGWQMSRTTNTMLRKLMGDS